MLANLSFKVALSGLVIASLTPTALMAQTPLPKKEADLIATGNKPLTGAQISALVVGKTAYVTMLAPGGSFAAGSRYYVYYRDAKTRVVAPSRAGAFKKFEANWWTEGDKLCVEVQVTREANSCYSVHQISSDLYQCNHRGDCNLQWHLVAGNPEKL